MKTQPYQATQWKLEDLLPAPQGSEYQAVLAALEETVSALEQRRDQLSADIAPGFFIECVELFKSIDRLSTRLEAYGILWFSAETQSTQALNFRNQIDQLMTNVRNRLLFFSLWWKALPDATAERLQQACADDAYYFESQRRFRPHTLSEEEEKVINIKDANGASALNTIYAMLTTDFVFRLEVEGEERELTRSELSIHVRSPDPRLRAAAYQELYRVYEQSGGVLAQIYHHLVRDWGSENMTLRQFSSPIAVRNLANDIPDAVVDTLLDVSRRNVGIFQRYFAWKAAQLGMDRLRRYDIYAPVTESDKTYDFGDAVDLVLDTFRQFSPQVASYAQQVFEEGHIDAEVRKGKDTGAFCLAALPGMSPWVLLNYTGKASDVATMAHELGHAVHARMAEHHSTLTFHSALPLAETASVFAEQLLTDRLLAQEPDVTVRRDLLVNAMDDAYATVTRQAYFVLFERRAHEMVTQGATVEQLNAAYLENLQDQFGDSVGVSPEFQWEWISIPHIYRTPFYCYAYSFGQLLVLSLYQRYRDQGAAFIPHYLRILGHGGSKSPDFILSEAGIDMSAPAFWEGGFKVIDGLIDELEALE